jgi:spore coat polysaccharide biosynthesis protein SpsF
MIVAIIQARMGSTRLPGKVLKEVCNRPLLYHVVSRLRHSRRIDRLVVATSIRQPDDDVAAFCEQQSISCFRGSEDDVLDRYYNAAHIYAAETVVRITADCPLIDPVVLDEIIEAYQKSRCDYASNTLARTYPDGLDVEVFSFEALKKAWQEAILVSEREHVTPYIWKNPDRFKIHQVKEKIDRSYMRWTVDEPEDLEFIRRIYSYLYRPGRIFLMREVLELLEERPELMQINQGFISNEGYIRSLDKDHIVDHTEMKDRRIIR